MKVHDPKVVATQPDPVNVIRVIDNVDVAVIEIDINRPKRPDIWISTMESLDNEWLVHVQLVASSDTPESHRDERVSLNFKVTGVKYLQVIRDAGRYTVDLVFIDRGEKL